jgi:transcription elongation factor Elf1
VSDNVVTLAAVKSQRQPERRIFRCIACGSFTFKVIEQDGDDLILSCANCEGWITDFAITKTRPIE